MAKILKNERLSEDFYLMVAEEENQAEMGQIYMLRAWDEFPVLSRPISVFDADGKTVSFLYKAVGKGTEIFSRLEAGDEITLDGPHGNGYPDEGKKIALVGGGVGIAPLYLTAKKLKESDPERTVDIYLGFSGEPVMIEQYEAVADRVVVNVGGFITDEIDPREYDCIMTCGPEIMMKVLCAKCKKLAVSAPVYVSMENRMACGIGACLVCTCRTSGGNKRTCKDGPVFLGSEVFGNE